MFCSENNKTRNVIIDVDVGSDDAWACLMLLRFEKKYNIKVLAITCVHGNTTVTNVAKNLIRVLKTIDRLDVPIYMGAEMKLIPPTLPPCEQWHGCNGFCDHQFDDEIELKGVVRKEHAVNAMRQILLDQKNVSLIFIGPLTNLALLIKMYPKVVSRICKTYIMGGNRNGVGNITRTAEFNFYSDPESAFIAFDSLKSDIVLLPWESCLTKNLEIFSMDWRLNVLGGIQNAITDLLNPIDKKCYRDYSTWIPCDAFLVAVFIDERVVRTSNDYHATIELAGNFTRGQVVLDHLFEKKPNCTIVDEIDEELFRKMILYTAGHKKIQ